MTSENVFKDKTLVLGEQIVMMLSCFLMFLFKSKLAPFKLPLASFSNRDLMLNYLYEIEFNLNNIQSWKMQWSQQKLITCSLPASLEPLTAVCLA